MEKEQAPASAAQCHALRVVSVIRETADACSLVLGIPDEFVAAFRYRAGQFITIRVPYAGKTLSRSYSLASSPDSETEHKITIKRIVDGRISNWINDKLQAGDVLQCMTPGGLFVLNDGTNDVVLFAGGSGITPVISLIKTLLTTTQRRARLVYANRDESSVIFRAELDALEQRYGERLELVYRYDDRDGFVETPQVHGWAKDRHAAEFYVCGPAAFMSTVERALLDEGIVEERVHIERFVSPPDPDDKPEVAASEPATAEAPATISVFLDGKLQEVPYESGQTVLVACQTAGLRPPFSCTEAFCGCCMAKLAKGQVRMKHNDFLSKKEVAQGWVLTCQSIPLTADVEIRYPD